MNRKALIPVIVALSILGCHQKPTTTDYSLMQNDFKYNVSKNNYVCIQEMAMKADDSRYARNLAKELVNYFKHQQYSRLKPFLTPQLQTLFESKDIENNKLDIFLPGASQILGQMENFELTTLYMIKTNPQSTKISGFCHGPKENLEKGIYFNIQKPAPDEISVIMLGKRGETIVLVSFIAIPQGKEWKISHLSLYPGGANSQTSYNLFQIAQQFQSENKKYLAYMYYQFITDMTPIDQVLPEFIKVAYDDMTASGIALPSKNKGITQDWEVEPGYPLQVYDFRIMPVNNQFVLFVAYLTESEDVQQNDLESNLLKDYITLNFPEITTYFDFLITEATLEIPEGPDYKRYAKSHNFKVEEYKAFPQQQQP